MDRGSEHDQCEPLLDNFHHAIRRHGADVFHQSGSGNHYRHDHTVAEQRERAGFIVQRDDTSDVVESVADLDRGVEHFVADDYTGLLRDRKRHTAIQRGR
jgi:hypothetical protein